MTEGVLSLTCFSDRTDKTFNYVVVHFELHEK
jgi:hypothetical protein